MLPLRTILSVLNKLPNGVFLSYGALSTNRIVTVVVRVGVIAIVGYSYIVAVIVAVISSSSCIVAVIVAVLAV